jgi:MOSC domain-containing protein
MIVSQVHIYPVKSCGGIALDAAEVGARGFVNDRLWMLVDPDGDFLTQREQARMALIQPTLDSGCLRLSAPGMNDFDLPLDQAGRRVAVSIWHDAGVGAVDQGDLAADWFSTVLSIDCRLVRMADDTVRQVDQQYAPRAADQVGFADAFPFLVISEESLADLNTRLDEPLPMNRFRPNIVMRGADEPYAEDSWRAIQIGGVTLDLPKACGRCAITTTNQTTAARGKEPLKTLATYRQGPKSSPLFGQNAVQRAAGGTICVGTAVEVIAYRRR